MPNENDAVVIEDADVADVGQLTPEQEADESTDWKARAKELEGIARRRTTQLKKAKDFMGKTKTPEPKPNADDQAPKKGELDYGQKAFLASAHGVKDADEVKLVQDAMRETGKTLEEVMASKFIQGQLTEIREEKAAEAATPGKSDRNGEGARDQVDYWIKKGDRELPPNTPENRELRTKIVNARLKQAGTGSPFTSNPVVQ